MTLSNPEALLLNGKELYDSIPLNSPKVGLSLKIYWDYIKNDKTEFEVVCLLGFLALKSILGQKKSVLQNDKQILVKSDGWQSQNN